MADERDRWLDRATAEKLLRGERVEAADGHAAEDAARVASMLSDLAHVARVHANTAVGDSGRDLDDVGSARPEPLGELPGETAALAAFRQARDAARRKQQPPNPQPRTPQPRTPPPRTPQPHHAQPHQQRPSQRTQQSKPRKQPAQPKHTARAGTHAGRTARADAGVRPTGPSGARGSRGTRSATPTPPRAARRRLPRMASGGPAVTLIGCVLGSAALALGSGVFLSPATTGSNETPIAPAPLSGGPNISTTGGTERLLPPVGSLSRTTGTKPWESIGRQLLALAPLPGTAGAGTTAAPGFGEAPGPSPQTRGGFATGTPSAWYAAAVDACQSLRDGTLDDRRTTRLLQAAKGRQGAEEFCDALLEGRHTMSGQPDGGSPDPRTSPSGGFGMHDPHAGGTPGESASPPPGPAGGSSPPAPPAPSPPHTGPVVTSPPPPMPPSTTPPAGTSPTAPPSGAPTTVPKAPAPTPTAPEPSHA